MGILRRHLLLCMLIALLSRSATEKYSHEDISEQDTRLSQDDDPVDYRLPTSVKPISYEIILIPDIKKNFTRFEGKVKITAVTDRPTDVVTLNVGNIKIGSQSVILNTTNLYRSHSYDNVTEKHNITLSKTLEKNSTIIIVFEYEGNLSDSMIGFYRSSYIDEHERIKWLAATQFQPIYARHAFPCFDEPSFKAKFTIRIARNENYTCLSNMPLAKTETQNGTIWDTFKESVPMSTYLVAFVISEFSSRGQKEFKVWSKPSSIDQAGYALNIGTKALRNLSETFQQKYELPKMDMVAVPDFEAGAMENWGLVTYRETRMLYNEKESSALAQQSVASVIVHELTHMWFGNLVTPEWWSYLWLSEAFARYFQYFGTANIEVSWNMTEQFVVEQHQTALIADGLESSLPMTREVSSQSQINGMGDAITYSKGASIVRMMSLIFGNNTLEPALRDYLQKNKKEGLANPDALWTVLQDQVNRGSTPLLSVKKIMNTWTTQAGYPVVTVTVSDKGVLNVTQQRFLLRNLDETPTNVTWWVPLTWTTQSKPDFDNTTAKYWLTGEQIDTVNLKVEPKKWVIFNVRSSGFYRVNYDHAGWQRILDVLKSTKFNEIHVLNRAAIMDDLLNLARGGYQDYEMVLDAMTYLKFEDNYLPFKAALNGLDYLNKRLKGYYEHSLFKKYVLSLIEERRKELGYEDREGDDRLTILLRRELNEWACNLGDEECITIYMNKFEKLTTQEYINSRIEPNERSAAYCVAVRNGTSDDWEFLWNQYYHSNNAADQLVILNALGCSLNTTILEKYLKYAITSYQSSRIRKQDSTSVFAAVYSSSLVGAEYVLDFVDKYYEDMEKYYGGQSTIAAILNGASQRFSTLRLVDRFQELVDKHKEEFEPILRSLESSLKVARYELEWYESASIPIVRWLQTYEDNQPPEDMTKYRLPDDIKPVKYNIIVTPYLEIGNFAFDGNVKIEAEVVRPTRKIVLHSAEIKAHRVIVTVNKKEVEIDSKYPVSKYDFYVIELVKELAARTKLIIEIAYTGHLNASDLRGFYKSSYENQNGETRWLAATHLEPVGARRTFPCFDEPAMKAIFTVKVSVPPGYHALSNMNVKMKQKDKDGREIYIFSDSKKMSTYLVAVVVSDFIGKSMTTDKINYAVWARPNAFFHVSYALSVMDVFVNFFESKLNQDYQLPKMDMVALPDFPSGAMENWGLLTYRETGLLYDENGSPMTSKQSIRNVIAHEISHQWFGNLVSPLWWSYLWLSEGFARYFQYHAAAAVYRDTTMEPQFVVDQVHSALSADSSSFTHAMTHDVYSPNQIRGIFDSISYAKAASILRMIEKSYGSEVFYEALGAYLKEREYDVATPEDLYKALQAQIKKAEKTDNIKAILDTWTTQAGYPVLHVDIKDDVMTLKQERFLLKKPEHYSTDPTWHIPITWMELPNQVPNTTPRLWFTEKEMRILPNPGSLFNRTMVLNVLQSGFYRVNYNEKYWLKLIDHITTSKINQPINRAALIDDIMNLARANYVDYKTVISLTKYLRTETDYLPWRAFYNNLPYLSNRLRGREMEGLYKKYLISLIEPLYSTLHFIDETGESDVIRLRNMLRIYTREWACKLDIADCRFHAANYFLQKRTNSRTIPANYRGVVYCTAMRTDPTKTAYNFLWKEYLNSNLATDKLVILSSLACSQNRDILETLLLAAVTEDSRVRYQDSEKVFSDVYDASLIGVEVVMNFVKKNYDIMHQRFGDYTKIQSIVSAMASRLSTYDLYDQYQSLLDWLLNKEPAFRKTVDSYVSTARYEFDWYERQVPEIFEGLDKLLPSDTYRLPTALYPELYNISLTPHMKNGTFDGRVRIYMRAETNATAVFLNSHDLNITSVKVYGNYGPSGVNPNAVEIQVSNYTINATTQQLKIYLTGFVHNGEKIMAEIEFRGTFNDDMEGFYRSYYHDREGNLRWLATTHFEPTYARRAFPCFDEPAFKSKFTINIQRTKGYNALSNMPLSKETPSKNNGYVWDTFESTPVKMSSYLVAFVISEFTAVGDSEGFVKVWGRPDVVRHGSYAQDIAKLSIHELEEFTGIDYSLPKLDLVGIPDFKMGAMENWGLVTFREYGLFHKKDVTTGTAENYIINVVAHELAHMWFGNLVTCEWWEYIWLNEGFAEYFQWFTADLVRPNYKFMDQFVVYELHPAMLADSADSVHPMTNPVKTPQEISGIFGYVTYGKSSSVLRMIFSAFDERIHRSAIRDYLKKHQQGTVRPTDLWSSFEPHTTIMIGTSKVSVEEVMDSWTNQPGYPVVHAELRGTILTLTQERFRLKRRAEGTAEFYWIPIHIVTSVDNNYATLQLKLWLGSEPVTKYINPINEWFVVNYRQTGFYRVNYDSESWRRLIEELDSPRFESIHVLNRAQIIDDLFNLARAGYVPYDLLMNATRYLSRETSHLPWKAFYNGLSYIYERYKEQDHQKELTGYVLNLTSRMYNRAGFDDHPNDQHLDELNREMFLQWTCKLNEQKCVNKTNELFTAWRNDTSNEISRNARAAVYCAGIKDGSESDWKFLWTYYQLTNFASERKIIINALGCSRDRDILQLYLKSAINGSANHISIRKQDVSAVFASVYTSSYLGVNVFLDFLIANAEDLHTYYGSWSEVGALFRVVASYASTDEQHNKLLIFTRVNANKDLKDDLEASLDIMWTGLQWYGKNGVAIARWIENQKESKTAPDSGPAIAPSNIILITILALIPYLLNRD